MNENIDLTKILKDCPKGFKLYSLVYGEVEFQKIELGLTLPIVIKLKNKIIERCGPYGKLLDNYDGECILFPSKTQRDWSKFTAPWYKSNKFDPKTLKPFDKVLVRDSYNYVWQCDLFSHIEGIISEYKYRCIESCYKYCIPYNEDTEHLLNTCNLPSEYYIYWEGYPEME